ncbi:MAG: hypothetical protein E7080_10685 [Bacteroidales bacterium]|nr:hypothetical protein [Bacteroidales bacterium]
MKKFITVVLVLFNILCLTGCGKNDTGVDSEITETLTHAEQTYSEELAIAITDEVPYTVIDVPIESEKATKSKFNVNMDIYLIDWEDDNGGNGGVNPKTTITTKIPLNRKAIGLQINNNNEEIFIVCSGYWRLEKLVNGNYEEIKVGSQKYEANSSCGPKQECYVLCELDKYNDLIETGKYRIISPTLNIAKEINNHLEDYTYQGEKSFIVYKEFEFIDDNS